LDKKIILTIVVLVVVVTAAFIIVDTNGHKNNGPVNATAEELMPDGLKVLKDYSGPGADVMAYAMKTTGSPIAGAKSYASQDFVSTSYLFTVLLSKYTVTIQIFVFDTIDEAKNTYSNRAMAISGTTQSQYSYDVQFDWNDHNKHFDNGLRCMTTWDMNGYYLLQERNVYIEITSNSISITDEMAKELYNKISGS